MIKVFYDKEIVKLSLVETKSGQIWKSKAEVIYSRYFINRKNKCMKNSDLKL